MFLLSSLNETRNIIHKFVLELLSFFKKTKMMKLATKFMLYIIYVCCNGLAS